MLPQARHVRSWRIPDGSSTGTANSYGQTSHLCCSIFRCNSDIAPFLLIRLLGKNRTLQTLVGPPTRARTLMPLAWDLGSDVLVMGVSCGSRPLIAEEQMPQTPLRDMHGAPAQTGRLPCLHISTYNQLLLFPFKQSETSAKETYFERSFVSEVSLPEGIEY